MKSKQCRKKNHILCNKIKKNQLKISERDHTKQNLKEENCRNNNRVIDMEDNLESIIGKEDFRTNRTDNDENFP